MLLNVALLLCFTLQIQEKTLNYFFNQVAFRVFGSVHSLFLWV